MKVWIAEVVYSWEPGYLLGVYVSEEAARLAVAADIHEQGFPDIKNVKFSEHEVEG